jgi:hypothetical protein
VLAAITEIFPSWCLWMLGPTDSVRVWYPSVWSYLGEQFLVWLAVAVCLGYASIRVGAPLLPRAPDAPGKPSSYAVSGFLSFCIVITLSDVATSWFLGAWQEEYLMLWFTHRLADFMKVREPIFVVALILGSLALIRLRRISSSLPA